ncbi:MAG: ELM1/GtrOC1 family putative glycosyltransferase, partial [Gammaproteobacteria bacterium]
IIRVLVISDGKPGHFNTSAGLLNWLGERYTIREEWITVKLRFKFLGSILRYLISSNIYPPIRILKYFYQGDTTINDEVDLVISAGGDTAHINAIVAREFRTPNLLMSSLRGLPAESFSHVLTVLPAQQISNSVYLNLVPTIVRIDKLQQAGQQLLERIDEQSRNSTMWALLIGGDTAAYKFRRAHYACLAHAMNELSRRYGIKWLLTTSRRTGAGNEKTLEKELAPSSVAYAVYYHRKPEKVVTAYLGLATRVFCTEDSGTMMMEAIASTKPVTALFAEIGQPPLIHKFVVNNLQEKHLIDRISVADLEAYDPGKATSLARSEVVSFINMERDKVLKLTEGLGLPQD